MDIFLDRISCSSNVLFVEFHCISPTLIPKRPALSKVPRFFAKPRQIWQDYSEILTDQQFLPYDNCSHYGVGSGVVVWCKFGGSNQNLFHDAL